MAATAADLKFFAPATLTDAADGGGPRTSTLLQDGVSNTIFPNVSASDRTSGRTRLRKFFPGATNADGSAVLGASVAINEVPTDPAVSVALLRYGDASTRRAAAIGALEAWHRLPASLPWYFHFGTAGGNSIVIIVGPAYGSPEPRVGQTLGLQNTVGVQPDLFERVVIDSVGPVLLNGTTGASYRICTLTKPLLNTYFNSGTPGATPWAVAYPGVVLTEPRCYGTCAVPGVLASGDTAITVSDVMAQVVPYTGSGTYPTANLGIEPGPFAYNTGRVRVVQAGDTVTLWQESATTPATTTSGTISAGRTNLDQMALVDNNGNEIGRWLLNGPTPVLTSGSATVNLTTGVLTVGSSTGWVQPVSLRHRISHRSLVQGVSGNVVTLATALTRAFPAGAVMSSHASLGDLQARAYGIFGQQAWTRVWQDTLIGNPATLQYTGTITVTNQGAETDRWLLIFANSTTFTCYSERLGLVGNGDTSTTFAPVNAATGAPYFTLSPGGWGGGILAGSCMRFNTDGASAPAWALQCIKPSSATGTTRTAMRMHGSV